MAQKKKNATHKVQQQKKESKVNHKSKSKTTTVNSTVSKKTKTSMKKSLSKFYLDKKPPSRYTPQQIEERKQYIRNTVMKGNQQFQEDLNSHWYSEHSCEDYSSTPLYQMESLKEVPLMCPESSSSDNFRSLHQQQQNSSLSMVDPITGNRHVSFSGGSEIHLLQVDRAPPGRDNPIFDTKKTWITQLMSKKPKKSSIKIQVDRKGGICQSPSLVPSHDQINDNELAMQFYHQEMNIDSSILIDYASYRVLYQENQQTYLVNTHFSYTL